MIFLPVVERELRVAARRRNTYWTRFAAGLVAMGLCAWVWLAMGETGPGGRLAKTLFLSLSGLAFAYSLMAGIHVTADCLSEEKRDGTLGLLFLTDLRGYDVVLGKLAATSLNAVYRLLAVFPVLAIPLLLGGLTAGEFWRMALVLLNTLFLSLAAGILVSSLSVHERKTMAGTFLLILLIAGGSPLLGYVLAARHEPMQYNEAFNIASPVFAFVMSLDSTFNTAPDRFWISVTTSTALALTCIGLASFVVRHSWKDKPADQTQVRWRERWDLWRFGVDQVRRDYRARLLEVNPYFWNAARNRLKPAYVFGFLGLAGAFWLWLYFKYPSDMLDPASFIPTAIFLHTALKLWLASEACRPLSEDRRAGTLELLLSTPLSVQEILNGQILALKRQFAWPVILVLVADFAMFLGGLRNRFLDSSNDWPMICLAGVIILLADLYTLAWLGMWLGLTSRKANWASSGAVMRILILPWVLFFGFVTATVFINIGRFSDPGNWILGAWFVIALLNDLAFLIWARANLFREFRNVAMQRFDAKQPRPHDQAPSDQVAVSTAPAKA